MLQGAELGRRAFWTDAPSTQISFHTKHKFHAWHAAIASLVLSFVPYSQRSKWFKALYCQVGSLCSWELQDDTHRGQGGQFNTICFLTLLALIFMGTQNGKEMKNLTGSLLSPFLSLQWKHSLVSLLVTICVSFELRYFTMRSWISVSVCKGNWLFQCKLC